MMMVMLMGVMTLFLWGSKEPCWHKSWLATTIEIETALCTTMATTAATTIWLLFFAFHYGIFGYTLFRRVCCRFYARICIAFVAVVNAILIMIMKFCWFLRQHPSAICPCNSPFSSTPLPLAVALWFTWLVVGARGVYAMLSFCHGTRLQFHSSGDQSRHLNSYLNYICLYINPPPFCEHFHLHSPA